MTVLLVFVMCIMASQGMTRQHMCRHWSDQEGLHYSCGNILTEYLKVPNNINFFHLDNTSIKSLIPEIFQHLNSLRWLNLSENLISNMSNTLFDKNVRLEVLDLSYNKITFLPNSLFQNLVNLHVLKLQKNRIRALPDDIFMNQRELDELDLSRNYLLTLREVVLSPIAKPEYLNISGNQFKCDCDLLGVRNWVQKHRLSVDTDCEVPENSSWVHWSKIERKDVCNDVSMMNDTGKSTSRTLTIALSVILVILAIGLLIVVFWKRRKSLRLKPTTAHKLEEAPEKNESEDSADLDGMYANVNKNKKRTIRKQKRPESVGFYESLKEESLYFKIPSAIQLRSSDQHKSSDSIYETPAEERSS